MQTPTHLRKQNIQVKPTQQSHILLSQLPIQVSDSWYTLFTPKNLDVDGQPESKPRTDIWMDKYGGNPTYLKKPHIKIKPRQRIPILWTRLPTRVLILSAPYSP